MEVTQSEQRFLKGTQPWVDPQKCIKLACWHMPVIPALGDNGGESHVQGWPGILSIKQSKKHNTTMTCRSYNKVEFKDAK